MASELEVGKLKVGDTHGEVTLNNTSGTSGSTLLSQTYNGSVAELRIGSNISTTSTSAMNVITGDAGDVRFNGQVGVGCDPDAKLEVNGDAIWLGNASSDASGRILFNENTSSNGTQGFSLLYAGSANPTLDGTAFTAAANSFNIIRHTPAWGTAGTVAMSVARDTGLCTFSSGINLGHENLTKYDEGTFTPTLRFGGSDTGITYGSIRGGVYTRIGRVVYVQVAFALTSKGTATGNATITGMPFTCGDLIPNTSIENALSYSHFSGLSDAVAFVGGTTVQLRNLAGTNLTNGAFTDSSSIRLAGCYALASS